MNRTKKQEYFFERLNDLFTDWQRREKSSGRRGSQQEFADRINEVEAQRSDSPRGRCDYRYVSKWLNRKAFPDTYIDYIAEVLGVEVEELFPTTHDEKYKDDEDFMNGVKRFNIEPYCEEIGLDEEFVKAIRKQVDFERLFPLWTPVGTNGTFFDFEYVLRSEDCLSDSAPMDEDIFQIKRTVDEEGEDERLITMSKYDLLFLRDVQREVSKYIEFLFIKRRDQMREEVEEVNRRCFVKLKDGGIGHRPLTNKILREISPYYKELLVDEDENK